MNKLFEHLPIFKFVVACVISFFLVTGIGVARVFKKKSAILAKKKISIEIAESEAELQEGLMFRKKLPENSGMLFIFEGERQLSFWMKNTLIDLSIGFFDKSGVLVDIQEMVAAPKQVDQLLPTYVSKVPAKLALEMNKNWFKRNNIKIGDKISF